VGVVEQERGMHRIMKRYTVEPCQISGIVEVQECPCLDVSLDVYGKRSLDLRARKVADLKDKE